MCTASRGSPICPPCRGTLPMLVINVHQTERIQSHCGTFIKDKEIFFSFFGIHPVAVQDSRNLGTTPLN